MALPSHWSEGRSASAGRGFHQSSRLELLYLRAAPALRDARDLRPLKLSSRARSCKQLRWILSRILGIGSVRPKRSPEYTSAVWPPLKWNQGSSGADCQPMDIAIHAPQPGPQRKFRDCRRTIRHAGRTAVIPNHVTSVAQHLWCVLVKTQNASASAPQLHNSFEDLKLLLHVPTDVNPEKEVCGSVGRQGLLQQPAILKEVFQVLGKSHLVAIPGETFVAFLVIEKDFEVRVGPPFLAKVSFYFRDHIHELRLVASFSPELVRCRPLWIDGQVDKRNRARNAAAS